MSVGVPRKARLPRRNIKIQEKYKNVKLQKYQKTKNTRCQSVFLGKPGCLEETQQPPPRSLADHYYATTAAAAAAAADRAADQNLIRESMHYCAADFCPRKNPKNRSKASLSPALATDSAGEEFVGWISRLHALNTLAGHSHKFQRIFYNRIFRISVKYYFFIPQKPYSSHTEFRYGRKEKYAQVIFQSFSQSVPNLIKQLKFKLRVEKKASIFCFTF